METVNPSDWHLIPHGTAFEDYVVGRVCDHLWGRTVHGSDNISFTTQTLAFNPDYFNRVTAEAAGHPSEVVNPMPVFGLSVEDLSEADGPFLGASAIEYLRDVYPGQSQSARRCRLRSDSQSTAPQPRCTVFRDCRHRR